MTGYRNGNRAATWRKRRRATTSQRASLYEAKELTPIEAIMAIEPRETTAEIAQLLESMSMEELLEASGIAQSKIKGMTDAPGSTAKVRDYVSKILSLDSKPYDRPKAEAVQQQLAFFVIDLNEKALSSLNQEELYNLFSKSEAQT